MPDATVPSLSVRVTRIETLFHFRRGIEQALDDVIERRTRAHARQLRADLAARAADRMTDHARQRRPAIDLPPRESRLRHLPRHRRRRRQGRPGHD